jgi:hypothetical protein
LVEGIIDRAAANQAAKEKQKVWKTVHYMIVA